jgi:hypothetical protein
VLPVQTILCLTCSEGRAHERRLLKVLSTASSPDCESVQGTVEGEGNC